MKRVVVAMSGGVDSSMAAALLKKQGYEVIGIFLKFWHAPRSFSEVGANFENKCCSVEALEGARKVAAKLNIPFYVLDYKKSFKDIVVDYFISEYKAGRTPNPCVVCNQFIKFDLLLQKARLLGAEYLATGHYVRIGNRQNRRKMRENEGQFEKSLILPNIPSNPSYSLLTAKDETKDQSYFLWTLTQGQLKHLLFPIGDYKKEQVREMAKKWKLPTALRRESQEICFIFGTVKDFLKKYLKSKPGKILDKEGKVVGEHEGAVFYTIGQRRDLEIEPKTSNQEPLYVLKTDIKKNIVIVGEEKDLYSKELIAEKVNWIDEEGILRKMKENKGILRIGARIRYGHPAIPCRVSKSKIKNQKSKIKIEFKKPQRAITPGQSVVFYKGEEVLGGGIIKNQKLEIKNAYFTNKN